MPRMGTKSFIPVNVVVAATTATFGIGVKGRLPWELPSDMNFFRRLTSEVTSTEEKQNAVVMGRKTWESIPSKYKPLKNRLNVVISSSLTSSDVPESVKLVKSLREALSLLQGDLRDRTEAVFIIGGASVYKAAFESGVVSRVFWTRIGVDIECDTFVPKFWSEDEEGETDGKEGGEKETPKFRLVSLSESRAENGVPFDFAVLENEETVRSEWQERQREDSSSSLSFLSKFQRKENKDEKEKLVPVEVFPLLRDRRHEELQYLDLIAELINFGVVQDDRTGVGVRSKFGRMMRFDLRETFPLLTTKRVFWRGVVEELLWFVRGDTNAKNLSDKKVRIWDANGSREFLDGRGLQHREEGDLGPVYGFQWRHFGAAYKDMHADYSGEGVDQLSSVVETLKKNPNDRRLIVSAWNPSDLPKMALPPCHLLFQFYAANGELSCSLYQRSCDVGLGVPFNIASYSLLTMMVAQATGLKAREFVHFLGHTHVYKNHVEPLKTQLKRTPRPFPVLKINPEKKDLDSFDASDFELDGYRPWGKIEMEMAV
uniref:Bifunctional dihydrofolate reductase-thymidylate synthase n=1 Tax=Chromera velia CCMP2878 TaxID=1169474 RepID=A0A0G4HTD0_9ALVE|mmetsp:Transcript_43721/g.86258  ORF Transcript_43721/g.86258 Transcript_43721/m.86258 type:complete len:543 (+) Transcript_43721:252-1880(+)|eukprot:Cvel_8423.t1-p1 / transcript=Cvel_8423.t1 / gene=Cvel_8423 / organism=Chromera_velia_CCMP2878 / gene_product=Bifunctional dihydrofolate reductase-thymidylate, putative / transcript_product=Bifunctional dihydrofolate reductase-thymidylate, putative / location=Cvel_scaffold465:32973-39013(+) / protein_length=542 / sequence_SO=supercontig / SO=protein_coding / is_pseudo=false